MCTWSCPCLVVLWRVKVQLVWLCVFVAASADLVRTRNFVKKFILMRANIQAVSLKIQTLRSQAAMANAMKGQCRDVWLLPHTAQPEY